jgi:hypothetical protein
LFLGDDEGENRLESQRNDLGDDFVDYIAERYWPEVLRISNSFLLGNEGEKCSI